MKIHSDLVYGTAWKEADTQRCVRDALAAGFLAIDTANQRKHYFEQGVGDAIRAAIDEGMVSRDELFLQTKFTFLGGQDDRLFAYVSSRKRLPKIHVPFVCRTGDRLGDVLPNLCPALICRIPI